MPEHVSMQVLISSIVNISCPLASHLNTSYRRFCPSNEWRCLWGFVILVLKFNKHTGSQWKALAQLSGQAQLLTRLINWHTPCLLSVGLCTNYISFIYTSAKKVISNTKTAVKHFHKSNIKKQYFTEELSSLYCSVFIGFEIFQKEPNKLKYFTLTALFLSDKYWTVVVYATPEITLYSQAFNICWFYCFFSVF